ncbi:MAG: 50S ribosomal protein L34e [Candidatus Micrarchaeia archaeon]
MVEPGKRCMRARKRRSPAGNQVHKYKRGKPARKTCALCSRVLHGVPNRRPAELKKLARSSRAPTRPFAGVLCGACVAVIYKEKARLKNGFLAREEVPLDRLKFLEQLKK